MSIYRIADLSVEINPKSVYTKQYISDYLVEDCKPDFKIEVNEDMLSYEKTLVHGFDDGVYESTAIFRSLCLKVLESYNGFFFHCSAVSLDGKAYLFTAPSGTGKSTHAQLWKAHFGDRLKIINDDKPIIRQSKNGFVAYGTPWNGKERRGENICGKIHGIFIIEQCKTNSVEKVKPASELGTLLSQTIRPKNAKLLSNLLAMLESLTMQVPIFRLKCNISDEAVVTACSVIE